MSGNPSNTDAGPNLPLLLLLLLNAAIVVGLSFTFSKQTFLPSCLSPEASSTGLALLLLVFLHVVWRIFGPWVAEMADAVTLGAVQVPLKLLTLVCDSLHPWTLSTGWLFGIGAVLALSAWVLGWSVISPFQISEGTPIVREFSIQSIAEGTRQSTRPAGTLEIKAGEQILVQAVLSDPDNTCIWDSPQGSRLPASGCATLYRAPARGSLDTLLVTIHSRCGTLEAIAGLHLKIVSSAP